MLYVQVKQKQTIFVSIKNYCESVSKFFIFVLTLTISYSNLLG